MRIGILAYRQSPYISANTSIAYTIGIQLAKTEEVIFIGRKQDKKQKDGALYEGIRVLYLNQEPIEHNSTITAYLERLNLFSLAHWKDILSLEKIIKNEVLDVLICITAPNEDAYIAMSARLHIPIYIYQLDPFYNYGDIENRRLKQLFINYLKRVNHIFTTQLLIDEYRLDHEISHYLKKISMVQFPKLKETKHIEKQAGLGTTLLYSGSLYGDRKPDFLINLSKCLPDNCKIVFCGICKNDYEIDFLKNNGIVCKGYCSQRVLEEEIGQADFLINIGNTVKNQLPSKVIEYIATGKPIINLSQIDDCSSMRVLQNYELFLNIDAKCISENKEIIRNYISESIGRTIPWEKIKEQYREYTPEYVANTILSVIKSAY